MVPLRDIDAPSFVVLSDVLTEETECDCRMVGDAREPENDLEGHPLDTLLLRDTFAE